jgi:8-oxo-dGTP pyrophosphatase MutT (NUDIX family)
MPLECARRELAEEAELRAEEWRQLQVVHTSPGVLSERVWIFAATGLAPDSGERDPTSRSRSCACPWPRSRRRCRRSATRPP